ncbi:serine dehydratase subunit alpha family protein [Vibrio stylophorae]|uniref:L-cysteine desulfidase family protein n=1 Tax=Vibrio stylophorae TaxID=659351 RepID=UPI0025B6D96F|nr:L-serine ammonia-lyase, iron-sulfur-dependent, subunit alpha [Vibrio stylophorae]
MKTNLWPHFIDTLKREVVPSLGCTEPVSVALAAATAMTKLTGPIDSIQIYVSANLMKNGMGVGIPGTGMVGLPIAAALGAIAGDANAKLEVLKAIQSSDVQAAKAMVDQGQVQVHVADVPHILYAKVQLQSNQHRVAVTIADQHTNIIAIEENANVESFATAVKASANDPIDNPFEQANLQDVFDFATQAPVSDLELMQQAYELNNALSQEGLTGKYGLQVGATFERNVTRGLLSAGLLTSVLSRTAAASDARMDGAMKAAMSNSGSGNQGIAATMPVVAVADHLQVSPEQLTRALTLSHLTAIYIKSHQNKLSALCGATTACMGSAAAITWLLGGNFQQMNHAICSMIGDISGMICDGAKTSCAMKVSSSAGAAVKAALMALDDLRVTGHEGIVAEDADASIRNLSALANGAMAQTDVQILDIMMHKAS